MSTPDNLSCRENLTNVPEFDIKYLYDDSENPSEVTVFTPEATATATEWITMDRAHTVPFSQIR